MKTGVELITDERRRQVEEEGFHSVYDDGANGNGELLQAALRYFLESMPGHYEQHNLWPWDEKWWKPSDDPIRNLTKAGALIAAEIDRLQRKKERDVWEEFKGLPMFTPVLIKFPGSSELTARFVGLDKGKIYYTLDFIEMRTALVDYVTKKP